MSEQYDVVFKGELLDGFVADAAQSAFAKAFKVAPEKVNFFFTGKAHTLCKAVDEQTAQRYKNTLAGFGCAVELQSLTPPKFSLDTLSLVPIGNEKSVEETPTAEEVTPVKSTEPTLAATATTAPTPSTAVADKPFACPKCQTEQTKGTECVSCGIIFEKYFARQQAMLGVTSTAATDTASSDETTTADDATITVLPDDVITHKTLAICAGVALLGALVWKFIAVTFNYELGLIAWGIGGAVGTTAALLGSHGQKAGIACAVLAVIAIGLGKYMAYQTFYKDAIKEMTESMREVYNEGLANAQSYKNVNNDESLREYMIDNGYSEAYSPGEVTPHEIELFNKTVAPQLNLLLKSPNYEAWFDKTAGHEVMEEIKNMSAFTLMKENFRIKDLIFLFLGIGTAFRLAYGKK